MSVERSSLPATDRSLGERMKAFGCPDLVRLDLPPTEADQIDYLDLLPRSSRAPISLSAVAEFQGSALLYLRDVGWQERLNPEGIADLQRRLANRSDPARLGLVRLGSLELYPIGFLETPQVVASFSLREDETTAPQFFQSLVHGTFAGNDKLHGTDFVFKRIYELLKKTTEEYVLEGRDDQKIRPSTSCRWRAVPFLPLSRRLQDRARQRAG